MNEKLIEKNLKIAIKAMGGLALKFTSPYHRGIPDRIVLMPDGKARFVELKSTGKKPTPLQYKAMAELRSLGFHVEVIDDGKKLNEFLNALKDGRI